jgi:hypothetical protein
MAHRCTGSFAVGNPPVVYSAGALVGDDDPILRTHAAYFEPAEQTIARQDAAPRSVAAVETATAAPNEARTTSTAARRRATAGKGSEE